jgi:uncharacterized OB-fold protein
MVISVVSTSVERVSMAAPSEAPPNDLSVTFWDACDRSQLVVQECQQCGSRFFVPEARCPRCCAADWQWRPSAGIGSVYSFTVVHRSFREDLPPPYAVAAIELDDGWTMLSNIVGCAPEDVSIGMRVRVTFTEAVGGRRLPRFVPTTEQP